MRGIIGIRSIRDATAVHLQNHKGNTCRPPGCLRSKSSQRSGNHSVVTGGHVPLWPNSGAGGSTPVFWLRRNTLPTVVQGLRGNQYSRVQQVLTPRLRTFTYTGLSRADLERVLGDSQVGPAIPAPADRPAIARCPRAPNIQIWTRLLPRVPILARAHIGGSRAHPHADSGLSRAGETVGG